MADSNVSFSIMATEKTTRAFGKTRANMRGLRRETRSMGGAVKQNRRIIQQAGMQMSDFAVQVGGGQSAILAFTQNAPQFIQSFGAIGGVLAALVTIGGTLALVMTKTGKSLNDLTPIAGILEEEFRGIAHALGVAKEATIDFANLMLNNLDRVFITAATFAGYMAGRWVFSFVAARGAVTLLTGSLLVLRGALIRTGFGALIVAAGELVYQFSRLVKGAGGFGEALSLLVGVAKGVFMNIDQLGLALVFGLEATVDTIVAAFIGGFRWILEKWDELVNSIITNPINNLLSKIGVDFQVSGKNAITEAFKKSEAEWYESAANAAGHATTIMNSALASIPELQKINEILQNTDDTGSNIDVRDWFKNIEDATGSGGALDKLKEKLTEIQKEAQSLSDSMRDTFTSGFMDIIKGTKSVGEAFRGMATKIIEKLFEVLVVQRMVGSFDVAKGGGSGLMGVIGKAFFPSFDGGGGTGNGPRSGGLDGKGGFMAMLHPQEEVIDRTVSRRSGGSGGGTVVVNQSFNFQANGDESVKQIINEAAPKIMEATKTSIINDRRRGGQMKAAFGA